jgi:arylsulfatase A-like enzyme
MKAPSRRSLAPILLALVGCGPSTPPRETARSVILLSIDTLRADRLGCYGNERDLTPAMDALAARGALFTDSVASAPWTVPTHMSLLTGTHPATHRVDGHRRALPADLPTLAEHLAAQGFTTGAIVNAPLLNRRHGFTRGFRDWKLVPYSETEVGSAPEILATARAWIEARGEERFFLFLHVYDVHSDYRPAEPYRARYVAPYDGPADGTTDQLKAFRLREPDAPELGPADARHLAELYDAEVRQLDDVLAEFLDWIGESGRSADTLVVLTSDHGEEFGEHGDFLHGRTLHPELVDVPLLLAGPGVPVGARLDVPASSVDLVATATSLLGVPTPASNEGVDLSLAWRAAGRIDPARILFSESRSWMGREDEDVRSAVRSGPHALHHDSLTGGRRLYDHRRDPGEQLDLASEDPERAGELWDALEAYLTGARAAADETDAPTGQELGQLRDLGYTGD